MADLNFGTVFNTLYNTTVDTLSAGSTALIADGQDLAGILLLITASWLVLMWMLSGDGVSALMDGFNVVLRYCIVSVLLAGWLVIVGGFFQGAANDLGGRLATVGVGSGAASAGERVSQTVNTIMIGAGRLLVSERMAPKKNCQPTAQGNTPDCVSAAGSGAELSWKDMLVHFPAIFVTWILRLIALLFMGLMVVAYLAVVFLAEIMFGIGITLGPILVPWLIWQRTEFLFDGWLRFMIGSTMTKIVAGLMTSLMTGVILAVKQVSESLEVKDSASLVAVDEFTAFTLCIVAALGTFFMWQVPSLAQGLISGNGSFTVKGFGRGPVASGLRNGLSDASHGIGNFIRGAETNSKDSNQSGRNK